MLFVTYLISINYKILHSKMKVKYSNMVQLKHSNIVRWLFSSYYVGRFCKALILKSLNPFIVT